MASSTGVADASLLGNFSIPFAYVPTFTRSFASPVPTDRIPLFPRPVLIISFASLCVSSSMPCLGHTVVCLVVVSNAGLLPRSVILWNDDGPKADEDQGMYDTQPTQNPPLRHSQHPYLSSAPAGPRRQVAYQSRSPGMDPFTESPSSPTPYSPSPIASGSKHYQHSMKNTMFPVRPYMSPQLAHHFDHLTTTSPALLQGTLPQVEESHVIIHEYGPHDGPIGTSVIVLCDVNFPSTPPPSNEESSSPVESPKNSSANKALRVVFGQCPVQTAVHSFMEPARSGAGQLCRLTATVPNLSSTGGAAIGRAGQIPMYVQVLSETHAVIETIFVGEFIYTTTGSRGETSRFQSLGS